ncbi:MAG TPA: acyltransferase [Flavisolibacter sp.]|jgi:peptidoglycan/LPS O-acetylase OafA/YrhL|nr:acyltransferase [Flavisolibacter sp.]
MDKSSSKHIIQLDGLRGLAILLVLLLHHFTFTPLRSFFYFGFAGVDLFFVLSGFLISGILLDTRHLKGYFRTFFLRRALRIMPLYFGVLIAFILAAPHFNTISWFKEYQIYFWTYTNNFLILQKGFFMLPLGHFWSLALEEQFYLVWPFFIFLLRPKYLVVCCLLLISLSIFLRFSIQKPLLSYGLPFAHLDGLLTGALIAIGIRKRKEWLFAHSKKLLFCASLMLSVLIVFYFIRLTGSVQLLNAIKFTVVSIFFGALLLHSLQSKKLKQILSMKWLLFLGKYSYGIYVFNSIFIHFGNWSVGYRLAPIEKTIFFVTLMFLVIGVSYISYHLYEKHFIRLKPEYPNIQVKKQIPTAQICI